MKYSKSQLNAISRSYVEKENRKAFENIKILLGIDNDNAALKRIEELKKQYNLKSDSYKVLFTALKKRMEA